MTPSDPLSTFNYFSFDGHGNIRELIDSTGTVTDRYDYDAFGNLLYVATLNTTSGTLVAQSPGSWLQTPGSNHYLYCGEQFDPDLGLYYNRARYLNTDSGRFWSADRFGGFNRDPQSLHRFNYAHANPVMGYDPSGNFTLVEVAATAIVVGTVATIARPAVRPMVAQVVGFLGGDPNARYSLSSIGVYDESEQLLDALGMSPDDFSRNLLADAFTELGTDAVAGAMGAAAGNYFANGLVAFRRATPLNFGGPSSTNAAEAGGTRSIGSADSAGRRGLSALGNEGAVFPTNAAARAKAAELGYTPVRQAPFNSHGQQVFNSGRNFITRDVDSHSGGAWKLFDSRGNRLGTYNEDLTVRIGK